MVLLLLFQILSVINGCLIGYNLFVLDQGLPSAVDENGVVHEEVSPLQSKYLITTVE